MATDPNLNDEILALVGEQLLAELKAAKDEGKALDPRKMKNAMSYLELVNPRAFAPKEPEITLPTTAKPAVLPAVYKTKAMRDKLRKNTLPYLNANDCAILNSFAEEDGADLITPTEETDDDNRGNR